MTSQGTAHISVVVYRGSPLDYPQYRHTSLWIRFADGNSPFLAHIVGPLQAFEFETKEMHDPTTTRSFAKLISVGWLRVSWTPSQITTFLQNVRIDRFDREFNCQTWIERALKSLKDLRVLTPAEYDLGINGMVDAIAEAEDEES
ncbi:hypothetical protein KC318_g4373 [Hortaea werneckii]|nr:hypothetical protein KC334_g4589 [Hortaea werneckii]KAI7014783.1 hypothetical protein KC355_g4561 [Hortaea werneckii]KAI7205371.1 hypothetical protein KC324_g313 [Hortaea werneckii]KAI7595830.1 hypothetical protein KC316_g272 [Hortaea werneckii]KAI7669861.1 hypothetical protein KC318_g4373 [Hortaea werneckii]